MRGRMEASVNGMERGGLKHGERLRRASSYQRLMIGPGEWGWRTPKCLACCGWSTLACRFLAQTTSSVKTDHVLALVSGARVSPQK